jgi:Holliday junction resolvase-like predicted endonuclease
MPCGAGVWVMTTEALARTCRIVYLRKRGGIVVARHYRPPAGGGEIAWIAWHCETLVLGEVKNARHRGIRRPGTRRDEAKQDALPAPAATTRGASAWNGRMSAWIS